MVDGRSRFTLGHQPRPNSLEWFPVDSSSLDELRTGGGVRRGCADRLCEGREEASNQMEGAELGEESTGNYWDRALSSSSSDKQ